MALQVINVGTAPNDGLGDPIRDAYIKCNDNFAEVYSRAQPSPPDTLFGSPGDTAGMYAYDENYFYYCFADYDGSSIIWAQVSQVGNVVISGIQSGNSEAQFDNINGNLVISIGGTANVAVFRSTGLSAAANVSAANVNATNFYGNVVTAAQPNITSLGTLSALTMGGLLSSSANITTTANLVGATVSSTGNVVTAANVNGGNLNATTSVYTPGIVSAVGNIITDGYFVGTFFGNVTGNFVVPGGNTQVIFNTTGNADASNKFTFDKATDVLTVTGNISTGNVLSTTVSTSGNVTGGNVLATGVVSSVGNIVSSANVSGANVVGTVVVGATVNSTGNISASGNVTGGNLVGGGVSAVSNITGGNLSVTTASISGNASFGNISVTTAVNVGTISTSGNIVSAANISGGNLLGTTTVSAASHIGSVVSVSGNVTGGNLLTGGIVSSTGNITSTGNIDGGNLLATTTVSAISHIGSVVSVTANITGGNLITGGIASASSFVGTVISVSGNITGGNLISSNGLSLAGDIVSTGANGVANIGSSTTYFNTVFAKATSAQYADLAENYRADQAYEPGTVVVIGGSREVTASSKDQDRAVVGVVSTQPAHIMNSALEGATVVTVALIGRVPCKVRGLVRRGDLLVSTTDGHARVESDPRVGTVIGKSLENFDGDQGLIEIVVGKL